MFKAVGVFFFGLMAIFASGSLTVAHAYERGDLVYLCSKNQKFMWVVGQDSWTACPVRVLSRSGGSHKVLATSRSCFLPGFGSGLLNRGREAWVEGYHLYGTRASCERQGKRASSTQRKQDYNIKLTNKCGRAYRGFVRYKNFSGQWVNTGWFRLNNDGKKYNAMGAKTKNKIFYFYFEEIRDGGKNVRLTYSNLKSISRTQGSKQYTMYEFKSSGLPAGLKFC